MRHDDLHTIADDMMPSLPPCPSDLGFPFRARVLDEFDKIPRYLEQGFLEEIR